MLLIDTMKYFVRAAFLLGTATLSDLTLRPSDLFFFPRVSVKNLDRFKLLVQAPHSK